MSGFKYFLYVMMIINLSGCGSSGSSIGSLIDIETETNSNGNTGINEISSAPVYDVYFSSSIGVSSSSGQTYESGIYGAHQGTLDEFTKIVELNGKLIDSCVVDNSGNIYWSDISQNGIFKSDANGKNIKQIVFDLIHPQGLAIDENRKRIYWSNWLQTNTVQSGEITYADLDGNNKKTIVTQGLKSGGYIFIDTVNDILYISDLLGGKIIKTGMEGGALETIANALQPAQLAIDYQNNMLVWADIEADTISSIDLDDLSKKDLIVFNDVFANPAALVVNKETNKILFVSGIEEKLQSSDLNGKNIENIKTMSDSSLSFEIQSLWIVE